MRRDPTSIIDRSPDEDASEPRRASWYTPGFSDGLGDRLLMFDNGTASSLELLRFKKEFSDHPAFEAALRARLDELEDFRHPGVASIRAVKWLGDGDGLALVSNYVAGRRLSELLHEPRGAVLALELVGQIIPVLALLESHRGGVAHGALTADRIVVTPDGQLVMVEHVLGPALATLGLPAGRVRVDLGLAVLPGENGISVGGAADVVQLALLAVSLVLGRRVNPAEYPECSPALLDEVRDARPGGLPTPPPLRLWLMRALHGGSEAFRSAGEAHEALAQLLDGTDARLADRSRPLPFPRLAEAPGRSQAGPAPVATSVPPTPSRPAIAATTIDDASGRPAVPGPHVRQTTMEDFPSEASLPARRGSTPPAPIPSATSNRLMRAARWVAAGIALVAIGEAVFIVRLLDARRAAPASRTPPGAAAPNSTPAGQAAASPAPADESRAATPKPETPPPAQPPAPRASAEPGPTPPASPLIGGVRIVSPIELRAFEDGVLVGSTAGAMAVTTGSHTFDLVNDAAGYRTRQTVQVKGGLTMSVTITPPNGRLSVNATPWAEVFIDGKLMGETPLANLSVPIGEHQILFRHPQFGEQRQTALVKVDTPTRISVTFQR